MQILRGIRTKKLVPEDILLTGWILCIGLAEAVHLWALFLGRSFSDAVKCYAVLFVLIVPTALAVFLRLYYIGRRKTQRSAAEGRPFTTLQVMLFLAFMLVFVWQMVTVTESGAVYRDGDMTAETVESFLETDGLYQINPMTGSAYAEGMPLRLKILCLPTFYGILCRIFGMTAVKMVWSVVPAVTLVLSYLAFHILAKCFFSGEDEREKRELFMLVTAVVFCVGDYMYGMDGLGLLYSSFRGVTIRNAVLLPYAFGCVLRRRWLSVALCILAEACIVWTLYGMGACLLLAAVMCLLGLFGERMADTGRKKEA